MKTRNRIPSLNTTELHLPKGLNLIVYIEDLKKETTSRRQFFQFAFNFIILQLDDGYFIEDTKLSYY